MAGNAPPSANLSAEMSRSLGALVCIVLGCVTAWCAECQSDGWRAPFAVRNAEPLNVLFLQATPESAQVLPRGESRISLHLDVINHLLFDRAGDNRFEQDFEVQRLTMAYTTGLGNGWDVALYLPVLARNGGFLDELINVWHRWFGFKGGGRASYRNYQIHERITQGGHNLVSLSKPAAGTGDTVLELRRSLGQSGRSFWALRAILKLPTGNPAQQFGSGAVDAGLGVLFSYQSGKNLIWHVNLSRVWVGKPTHLGASARDMVQWLIAVEYLPDAHTSLVLQIDDNRTPVVVGVPYADGARRSLTVGVSRDIRPGMRAELSITQNQFGWPARIAPDFHLHAGITWEYGGLKSP
ncbi:MAG: DUF3187 family protein [Chthonomonadetes bacterium]|nr:DUF3187 family protein [Chthonomonadetes bacterium]